MLILNVNVDFYLRREDEDALERAWLWLTLTSLMELCGELLCETLFVFPCDCCCCCDSDVVDDRVRPRRLQQKKMYILLDI